LALSATQQYATPHATTAADVAVRTWLWLVAGLVFTMVVVGGATRLTDSGLSITEWKPILGAIPPLGEADWHSAF
jgi:heme a synthase